MPKKIAKTTSKIRHFHPHETQRFDELSGLPLASFKRRAVALGIDLGILACVRVFFFFFGGPTHEKIGEGGWEHWVHKGFEEAKGLVESVFYFAVALKLGKGQTPGKWWMGIRVYSLTQESIGWWQAIERALGYGASLLEGGFGFFQYFIHRNRMTVHDRIAETIVVDVREGARRMGERQMAVQEPEEGESTSAQVAGASS